nr:hypothetical protein [Tanacetum cinerariifolium]
SRRAEKEIGLDHRCLLLPITMNVSIALSYNTQPLYKIREHSCGSNGWSKLCGQGQAFLSVQAAAMPEDHHQKTMAMKQKKYLFDELQNASVKLDDVKDDSISR